VSSARNAGFSLIELMVSTVLIGILMIFTMQIFTDNNRAYVKTDAVVDTQQSVRVISGTLERDLRHAGMMVPEGAAVCGIDDDAGPDLIYISDYTAIQTGGATGTFDGAEIQNAITNVSGGSNTFNLGSLTIESGAGDPFYDTDGNGTNDSDFQEEGGVIVVDLLNLDRGSACGRVSSVNIGGEAITVLIVTGVLGPDGGATTNLVAVPAIEYRVTGNELFRNGHKLAESIEDLQFAYFMDLNGDADIGTGEILGDGTSPDYVAPDQNASDLRAVRFNVVVRTRTEDERFNEGYFQALENRADPGAGRDGYRRRVHTNVVRLRNVGDRIQDPT
jgi:prepilin-type N-terminal cleavage/methylation domain-containing protein